MLKNIFQSGKQVCCFPWIVSQAQDMVGCCNGFTWLHLCSAHGAMLDLIDTGDKTVCCRSARTECCEQSGISAAERCSSQGGYLYARIQ